MKKKPPKKSGPTPEYDPQRHQNVLLEQIRDDVKRVAEGHGGLDHKIDKTNERLDEMGSDLQIIRSKVAEQSSKLLEHDRRFDRIEEVVRENRNDIKALKVGQERIEQKLDTVTIDHEQRIQKLETSVH